MSSIANSIRDMFEGLPNWARYATAGVAVAAVPLIRYLLPKSKRKSPLKEDFKPGVVYLYQFQKPNYVPNISPFCVKVETWLKMANIPYQNIYVEFRQNIRSKEGMLPFVELNGKEYADSSLIIRDLTKVLSKEGMEAHLTAEQRGGSRAIEQMVEATTLSSYAFIRYTEQIWEMLNEDVLGTPLSLYMTVFITVLGYQIKKRFTQYNPTCKHEREEIINIGLEDLKAISDYLGSKSFLTGSKPVRADATVFGVLSQIIYLPLDTPHKKLILSECKNLKDYCDRIKKQYWSSDWPPQGKKGAN